MNEIKKVLFVRTDKIGDVLLTTPCLSVLKQNYPDIIIDFLVSQYSAPILKNNPLINEIIIYDEDKTINGIINLAIKLRQNNYDVSFLFFVDFIPVLILFLSKIKLRVGPFSKIYSLFLNKRIIQNRSQAVKHEAEYNVDLLKSVFQLKESNLYPTIKLMDNELKEAKNILKQAGYIENLPIIGVHPSGRGSNLLLPKGKYFEIIDYIIKRYKDIIVLITGTDSELKPYEKQFINNKKIIIPKNYNLRDLSALISFCNLFITNSTGPLHIAAALGIKTISFYSPVKVTKPVRWGPLYKDKNIPYKILIPKNITECEKCKMENCPHFNCLSLISNEEIETEIDNFIIKMLVKENKKP